MSIDHDPRENPEASLLRNLRSGFATLLASVLVGWWLIYPDDRPSRTAGADAPLRIGYVGSGTPSNRPTRSWMSMANCEANRSMCCATYCTRNTSIMSSGCT